MNISEANAISRILRWLLGAPEFPGYEVSDDNARDRAAFLANRAHHVLKGGGLTADQVNQLWPARRAR